MIYSYKPEKGLTRRVVRLEVPPEVYFREGGLLGWVKRTHGGYPLACVSLGHNPMTDSANVMCSAELYYENRWGRKAYRSKKRALYGAT